MSKWSDQKIEEIIGNLLRAGVMSSAAIVFAGGVIYLLKHGASHPDYHVFQGEPPDLSTLAGIFHNAFRLHGRGIIQLGLLSLIATPVARVAFSIWGFAAEHDRMYMLFASIVLVILLYSLLVVGSAF